MGVITRAALAEMLWPGIDMVYGQSYNEYQMEWKKLFEQKTSDKAYEKILGFVGMGLVPKKPEGQSTQYDDFKQGYKTELTHDGYALGYILTHEEIEDNLYMGKNPYQRIISIANERAQTLAFSFAQTKEVVGANIYNRAFSGSYTSGDGSSLCSATHANKSGGTWSNQLATAADLSESSLEQMAIDVGGFTNDRGMTIKVTPKTLVIPRQLAFEAERILKSITRVGTADGDTNALRSLGTVPDVQVNHYFDNAKRWFVKTDVRKGMVMYQREKMSFSNETAFDTKNMKFMGYERYVFGWGDPRGLFGSQGA